jgi:hypothetical protein
VLRHQDHRIKATFGVHGILCSFSGAISQPAYSFRCSAVSLTYSAIAEMTGRTHSKGIVGPKNIRISIGNEVIVSGQLDSPIDSATRISGKVSWVQI